MALKSTVTLHASARQTALAVLPPAYDYCTVLSTRFEHWQEVTAAMTTLRRDDPWVSL